MGKRVLITGSSRGIGRAIALNLAAAGWSVAVHYGKEAAQAASLAQQLGGAASGIYQQDLADPAHAAELWERAEEDGPLDALVNNAGIYIPMDFTAADPAEFESTFRRTFAVNFESPVALIRAACRRFERRGGGKILNVASRVGFKGEGQAAFYAASKAALINLTRSLAVELAPKNIGFFAIAPGWVDTSMVREGMEERLPAILETLPLGRMASPEDCAAAATFLLSDGAAYLSGQTIDINGASYFH